jgi:hypothetical protein
VEKLTNNILASDMWMIFNGDPGPIRYKKFLNSGRPNFKHMIESFILYDRIIIPTQDFLCLPLLVNVLGEHVFIELIESGIVCFLRIDGTVIFVGGNKGELGRISEHRKKSGDLSPLCAPIDDTINSALSGAQKSLRRHLRNIVIPASIEVKMADIFNDIKQETHLDILNSGYLRKIFKIRKTVLHNTLGQPWNHVTFYGGPGVNSDNKEIYNILQLAHANLELKLAETANCQDSSTSSPVGHLLKAKSKRVLGLRFDETPYTILKEIAGLPDIGEGILEKKFEMAKLLKLRNSKNGSQFREWFHLNCKDDSIATAREYCSLLQDIPQISSLPIRIIRFILTLAVSLFSPPFGIAAGACDSFFIDRWLQGSSPKYFIHDIRQFSK